jgi:hypothetical protein
MHKILTAALMLTLAAASASAVSQAAAKPIPRAAANADREQSAPNYACCTTSKRWTRTATPTSTWARPA